MKKTAILLILLLAAGVADAATYHVATNGSNTNPGTQAAPFATLQKAHDVAVAGDTILLRGGTYFFTTQTTLTRDGTRGNRIRIFAFSGEKPVIDASRHPSGSDIIRMNSASWWHIKGLELKNGARQGIHAQGASGNNTFEQLNIHHIGRLANAGGTGTALAIYGSGSNNLVLNNDVHDNEDQLSFGGGANGINLVNTGTGNVIRGNRAWCNSDDGLDMWNSTPALIENNWIWDSGRGINCRATGGNGVAFKLGGTASGDGGHTVRNNLAWVNKVDGFHENSGDLPMKMHNNTAWNNGRNSFFFTNSSTQFRNNISHDTLGRVSGSQPFNSWTLPVTVSNADFQSLTDTCARGPRRANGSLPNCSFLRLAAGSDLIDKGTNVGIAFNGSAPDLGAFEF